MRTASVSPRALTLNLSQLSRTARFLIGISGGRDSVALLHALLDDGFRRLIVCHVDHALRGRASTADARFVQKLADSLNLPFESERIDVQKLAAVTGQSIETAARAARLAFFARVGLRHRCPTVFLAHHAGDQAETLLLNLFRGAGLAGLTGMSADSTQLVVPRQQLEGGVSKPVRLRLVRPMLGISREQVDAFIAARRLPFREDASNASPSHTRNRIRHELLPLVGDIFDRKVVPMLCRTADILRADDQCLSAIVGEVKQESLSVPELRTQPAALQRRRILDWLRVHSVPNAGFEEVQAVLSLMKGLCAKINLPGNWHARRRAKHLFLERSNAHPATQPAKTPSVPTPIARRPGGGTPASPTTRLGKPARR